MIIVFPQSSRIRTKRSGLMVHEADGEMRNICLPRIAHGKMSYSGIVLETTWLEAYRSCRHATFNLYLLGSSVCGLASFRSLKSQDYKSSALFEPAQIFDKVSLICAVCCDQRAYLGEIISNTCHERGRLTFGELCHTALKISG